VHHRLLVDRYDIAPVQQLAESAGPVAKLAKYMSLSARMKLSGVTGTGSPVVA
jgi:hypothetical protein